MGFMLMSGVWASLSWRYTIFLFYSFIFLTITSSFSFYISHRKECENFARRKISNAKQGSKRWEFSETFHGLGMCWGISEIFKPFMNIMEIYMNQMEIRKFYSDSAMSYLHIKHS